MHRFVALTLLALYVRVSAQKDCVNQLTYFAVAGTPDIYKWSSKDPVKLKKRTCDPDKYDIVKEGNPSGQLNGFSQRQQLSQVVEKVFLNSVIPYINSGKDEDVLYCDTGAKYVNISDYQVCYLQEGQKANVNGKTYTSSEGIDGNGDGADKTFAKYSVTVSYSCNGQARQRSVGFTFDGKATVKCVA